MNWIDQADGVFRGGGVKGLGLAGALLGFAEHPEKPVKKWVNVAGASAGAIIACYLACGHDANDMADLLKDTHFGNFQDFPPGGVYFGGSLNLVRKHGLAHGEAFRKWFSKTLDEKTFAATKTPNGQNYRLKLIAVDVTNRALLVLPDDLPRYKRIGDTAPINPDEFEIADAARMSMSIPYFFEPVQLVRDRVMVEEIGDSFGLQAGQPADRNTVQNANTRIAGVGGHAVKWRELTSREQKHQRSVIIDGGTLSNFPVWLFDVDDPGQPLQRPTFGFTLTGGKGVGGGFNRIISRSVWAIRFGFDIFHTSQEAWDARFVSHSTRVRTIAVDAGNVGTTDFNISKADQEMLLTNGRAAAKRFLDKFDLTEYENTYHRSFDTAPATPPGATTATAQLTG